MPGLADQTPLINRIIQTLIDADEICVWRSGDVWMASERRDNKETMTVDQLRALVVAALAESN